MWLELLSKVSNLCCHHRLLIWVCNRCCLCRRRFLKLVLRCHCMKYSSFLLPVHTRPPATVDCKFPNSMSRHLKKLLFLNMTRWLDKFARFALHKFALLVLLNSKRQKNSHILQIRFRPSHYKQISSCKCILCHHNLEMDLVRDLSQA